MRHCRFDGRVSLGGAETSPLGPRGSRLSVVTSYGAHVRGTLDLTDTVITAAQSRGLHADGIVIDNALLAARMAVTGPVCLIDGAIREQFVLDGACLANPGDVALNVGRSLLATGLAAEGEVRMAGARIDSALVLDDAALTNGRSASPSPPRRPVPSRTTDGAPASPRRYPVLGNPSPGYEHQPGRNSAMPCAMPRERRRSGGEANKMEPGLRLHDTAARTVREFVPVAPGKVSLYLCGATVQAVPHIGHLRSGVCFDILVRWLTASGYQVTFCRNVTDIDDKILDVARQRGRAMVGGGGTQPACVHPRLHALSAACRLTSSRAQPGTCPR